jgi:hypothetical protein
MELNIVIIISVVGGIIGIIAGIKAFFTSSSKKAVGDFKINSDQDIKIVELQGKLHEVSKLFEARMISIEKDLERIKSDGMTLSNKIDDAIKLGYRLDEIVRFLANGK